MRRMTEDEIERAVERRMDRLDYRLIVEHNLNQAQYDREVALLASWAERQYSERRRYA